MLSVGKHWLCFSSPDSRGDPTLLAVGDPLTGSSELPWPLLPPLT